MSGFSDYLEQALINHILRGTAYSSPSAIYVALFTADPTDANVTANELDDSGYARQAVTGHFNAPHATGGYTSNDAVITFPAIVDAQVVITHIGIYDALTVGNLLFSQALNSSKTLEVNDVLSFGIGALTITLA